MNIKKIKELAAHVRENADTMMWVDKEIVDLLLELASAIIKDNLECKDGKLKDNFISAKDFAEASNFIAYNTVWFYCSGNKEFRDRCAVMFDGFWYVDPIAAENFFYEIPLYKKRIDFLRKIMPKELSNNKYNLIKESKNNP